MLQNLAPAFRFRERKGPIPLIPDSPAGNHPKVSGGGHWKRLGTDHIDLYFQHRIDPAVEPEEVSSVMAELIREGKITHWGISEANEEYLRRANAVCPVTAIQNRYSYDGGAIMRIYFRVLEELHIGFVAFSPMANGFLTGKYGKGQQFDLKTDYRAAMPQFADKGVEQKH